MTAAPSLPQPVPSGRPVLGALTAAREVLSDCAPSRVWALSEPEVAESMRVLGELAATVSALTVAVLAESRTRGLGAEDGWGPVDWARACAPLMPLRDLTDAQVVASAAGELRLASVVAAVLEGAQPGGRPEGPDELGCGVLPVGKAAQIVRFHQGIRGMADPDVLEATTDTLLEVARGAGGLGERDLAAAVRHAGLVMRPDRLNDEDDEVKRAHRSLTRSKGPMGMARYHLVLEEEAAAIVDAALDALAKPRPEEDTGEHDRRAPETRRADALLDLVVRAVEAPDGAPRQAKTMLMLTVGLEVLEGRCRGAGLTAFGQVLSADTARRLACDAEVVPVVLGSRGEVLDQGQAVRLFTRAQIRHLWLRDQHCTFPGCSKPAGWTDAHHLLHWAHGGPTDTWNAALLCRAHHTVVHTHRYAGRVVEGPQGTFVQWDLTRGSYDAMLAARRTTLHDPADSPTTGVSDSGDSGGAGGSGQRRRPDVARYREWVAQEWPFEVSHAGEHWRPGRGPIWGAGPAGAGLVSTAADRRPLSGSEWTGALPRRAPSAGGRSRWVPG